MHPPTTSTAFWAMILVHCCIAVSVRTSLKIGSTQLLDVLAIVGILGRGKYIALYMLITLDFLIVTIILSACYLLVELSQTSHRHVIGKNT